MICSVIIFTNKTNITKKNKEKNEEIYDQKTISGDLDFKNENINIDVTKIDFIYFEEINETVISINIKAKEVDFNEKNIPIKIINQNGEELIRASIDIKNLNNNSLTKVNVSLNGKIDEKFRVEI